MQDALARVRNPALRQGLIYGIILGVILLALSFIITNFFITLFLILIASYLAGLRASQETGRMTTGTLAGLWTGLIGIVIPSLVSMVLVLINIDSYRKSLQASADKLHQHIIYTNSMVLTGLLINVLFLLIIGILPGVIGGLLGSIFGLRRAQKAPVEEYNEAMLEPPVTPDEGEFPPALKAEEVSSASETDEQPSQSSLEEPSSSAQQAE